jgi:hypothetical protein
MAKGISHKLSNGSNLDFEAQLWAAADKIADYAVYCLEGDIRYGGKFNIHAC